MTNHTVFNLSCFEHVMPTSVKMMRLHNQQGNSRVHIHRQFNCLRNFCNGVSCSFFIILFRFQDRFLLAFVDAICLKSHPKSNPGATRSVRKSSNWLRVPLLGPTWARSGTENALRPNLINIVAHFASFWINFGSLWITFRLHF